MFVRTLTVLAGLTLAGSAMANPAVDDYATDRLVMHTADREWTEYVSETEVVGDRLVTTGREYNRRSHNWWVTKGDGSSIDTIEFATVVGDTSTVERMDQKFEVAKKGALIGGGGGAALLAGGLILGAANVKGASKISTLGLVGMGVGITGWSMTLDNRKNLKNKYAETQAWELIQTHNDELQQELRLRDASVASLPDAVME